MPRKQMLTRAEILFLEQRPFRILRCDGGKATLIFATSDETEARTKWRDLRKKYQNIRFEKHGF